VRINVSVFFCRFRFLEADKPLQIFTFLFFFEIHRVVDDDTYRPSHDLRLITIHIIFGEEIYVERLHELIH